MKRLFLAFILIVLAIPSALAEITLTTDQSSYNLGNEIKASVTITQANDFEGSFSLTLTCTDYKKQYFLTPVTLEANFATALNVPERIAAPAMIGDCAITGELMTNEDEVMEQKTSEKFRITDSLQVLNFKDSITALPGESIDIIGFVKEAYGSQELKADAKIVLDENTYEAEIADGKFSKTISLAKDIKSGMHAISISITDAKSNLGSSEVQLEITAVPTSLGTEIVNGQLLPGSKLEVVPVLLDQANDKINSTISLELDGPEQESIFTKEVPSNEKLEYELSQFAKPGEYALSAYHKGLKSESKINVSVVREIKVNYDNELVRVENIGNILFEDELTFIIQNELNKFPIIKKLNIEPGKILNIDLSKEVPLGVYNILFPSNKTVTDAVQDVLDAAKEDTEDVLASNVMIHDNRPLYKRVGTGFATFTGSLIGSDGILTRNPLVAPILLIGLVGFLFFRYGRKPIMKLIKRDKTEEKDEK